MEISHVVNKYIEDFKKRNYHLYTEIQNKFLQGLIEIPDGFDDLFSAERVLDFGKYSLAILLDDGTVLKLGQKSPIKPRFFDAAVLGSGNIENIDYLIQPRAIVNESLRIWHLFDKAIRKKDYMMSDMIPSNIGWIGCNPFDENNISWCVGQTLYLLDTGSVSPMPEYLLNKRKI